jgi:hypothetical protein
MIRNQRGNSLLLIVILTAMTLAVFIGVQSLVSSFDRKAQILRVKNQQSYLESRVRTLVNSPAAFAGLQKLKLFGSLCANANGDCALLLENLNFDSAQRVFTARIRFTGDASIAPADVRIQVPDEIFQSAASTCSARNPAQPILRGFDATGRTLCRGIQNCGSGFYMTGVNPATAQPICARLPMGGVSCEDGAFIGDFRWTGTSVSINCRPRLDPFEYFKEGP